MSVTIFAKNLLESATVTASPAAGTTKPLSRLYDRDRALQYQPQSPWGFYDIAPISVTLGKPGQIDIDIDLGSSLPVTGWAVVNHTITGVTVTLFGDDASPPTTSRDTFAATAVDTFRSIATQTKRYWRVRVPATASAQAIGELMLGVPAVITENPFVRDSGRHVLGNVVRDTSPAGYTKATKKGVSRVRLPYRWPALSDANLALLKTAYADCDEGAKKVMVLDELGVLRWMDWTSASLEPVPIGGGQSEFGIVLEESL